MPCSNGRNGRTRGDTQGAEGEPPCGFRRLTGMKLVPFAAVLLALLGLSSCSDASSRIGGESNPSQGQDVPGRAPGWFADRVALPSCGFSDLSRATDSDAGVRACFRTAYEQGRQAEVEQVGYGDEGERHLSLFRILGPEHIEVLIEVRPPKHWSNSMEWQLLSCRTVDFLDEPGYGVDNAAQLAADCRIMRQHT